ncbi:MAG TPA: Gfo/Idh/MocA family oxidoreductase [bacterium]|nr:Gfo/Idh/MocA family oxidoreductase [bacterium]
MKKVKVGVIGVGHLGQHHARVYTELENAELVGIYDLNNEQAQKVAERCKCRIFDSYESLLKEAEAVSIAVPTREHFKIAATALKAGAHILVEKPITATLEEAKKLLKLAEKHKAILQVGHIERFNSAIKELSSRIKNPKYIECDRLAPFNIRGTDVSVVLDLMIHDIDIILSLVKEKVKKLEAQGVAIFTDKEDIANARIIFANGCVANITASRVSIERTRKIRIFEDNVYYSVDYSTQTIKIVTKKENADIRKFQEFNDLVNIEILKIDPEEPLKAELASFIDCVIKGKQPLVPGEAGSAALEIAAQIVNKIRKK